MSLRDNAKQARRMRRKAAGLRKKLKTALRDRDRCLALIQHMLNTSREAA